MKLLVSWIIYKNLQHFEFHFQCLQFNRKWLKIQICSLLGCKIWSVCVCVLVAQLRSTPYDPVDCSPPGSFVHGILQARTLEVRAISFSRGFSQPKNRTYISCLLHWQSDSLPLSHPGNPSFALYMNYHRVLLLQDPSQLLFWTTKYSWGTQ